MFVLQDTARLKIKVIIIPTRYHLWLAGKSIRSLGQCGRRVVMPTPTKGGAQFHSVFTPSDRPHARERRSVAISSTSSQRRLSRLTHKLLRCQIRSDELRPFPWFYHCLTCPPVVSHPLCFCTQMSEKETLCQCWGDSLYMKWMCVFSRNFRAVGSVLNTCLFTKVMLLFCCRLFHWR